MGTESKVPDEYEGVPHEMREAVERWIMGAETERREPFDEQLAKWFSHPDWHAVATWIEKYPSPDLNTLAIQKTIRALVHTYIHKAEDVILEIPPQQINPVRLAMPPARTLLRLGRLLLTKGAFKRYIEPHVADIHHEYFEALAANEKWRSRWIVFRGYVQVLWPLLVGMATAVRAWWKMSGA